MENVSNSTLPENRPVKARKPRRWPWIVGIVAAFGIGAGSANGGTATNTASTAPAPSTITQTVTAPPVTVTKDAPAAAPAPAASSNTLGNGIYRMGGTDAPAGQWKTTGPAGSMPCYWARLKNDSGDFDAIIANGNPTGPTSLTVKSGEYLELSGGCAWTH